MCGRAFLEKGVLFIRKREGKMKKLFYRKKIVTIIVLFLLAYNLSACSPVGTASLIEIENEEEQYKEVEKELEDLKEIQVKCFAPERFEEMKDIIYENYFLNKDDVEHQEEEENDFYKSLIYETGDDDQCQRLDWGDDFVSYSRGVFGGDYGKTEEGVIREEVEKLCKLLGLKYNDGEDGYVIERMFLQGNNTIEVYLKRNIKGKGLSLACALTVETQKVEDIIITFGSNQVRGIDLRRLSESAAVKEYQEEVFVDDPWKACKLLDNFFRTWGFEKKTIDRVQIAYVTSREEEGIYTLRPMVEFYIKTDRIGEMGRVYRVDLTTKEVGNTFYCCYCYADEEDSE